MLKKINTIACLIGIYCFLIIINPARAATADCTEQTAPAVFFVENGLLCLQKIIIAEQTGTTSYKASLAWSDSGHSNQFRLLTTEPDNLSDQHSPTFSTENGALILPKVDIPRTFGTERYIANLVLI